MPSEDNLVWVYVEFSFDSRVAHFYGRIDAALFERLLRKESKEMIALHTPYWYSEEDSLLACRDFQGADVLYFDPAYLAFLARLEPDSRVMKDIDIARAMGDMGLHRMGSN